MSNMCPFIITLSESSCVKLSTFQPCTVVALYGTTVGLDDPPPPGAAPPPPPPPPPEPPPPEGVVVVVEGDSTVIALVAAMV